MFIMVGWVKKNWTEATGWLENQHAKRQISSCAICSLLSYLLSLPCLILLMVQHLQPAAPALPLLFPCSAPARAVVVSLLLHGLWLCRRRDRRRVLGVSSSQLGCLEGDACCKNLTPGSVLKWEQRPGHDQEQPTAPASWMQVFISYLQCCSPWAAVSFALQSFVQAPWRGACTCENKEEGWSPFLFPGLKALPFIYPLVCVCTFSGKAALAGRWHYK